jgi:hypothetical protein
MPPDADAWEEDDDAVRWSPPGLDGYREMAAREIEAMSVIDAALTPLDDATRSRVLRWAADRFGVRGVSSGA